MSSLGREDTLRILLKLERAELILGATGEAPAGGPLGQAQADGPDGPGEPARRGEPRDRRPRPEDEAGKRGEEKAAGPAALDALLERLDDGSPVDPMALADGRDLSDDTKRRIVRLHRCMRKLAPHELLGVEAGADVATIRRAFAAASKELHPDRYYGKDLGSFREKLAQIFARVNEAAQMLQKVRRAKP
jgi:hypothetical protein